MDTTTQNVYTSEELIKESLWEREMIMKGRDAYYASLEGKDLMDTSIGGGLINRLLPTVVESIRAKQEEMAEAVCDTNDRDRQSAKFLLPMVSAENLAVAILQGLLRRLLNGDDFGLREALDVMVDGFNEAMSLQLWEQEDSKGYAYFWKTQSDKLSAIHSDPKRASVKRAQLKKKLQDKLAAFREQDDNTQEIQLSVATTLLDCIGYTYARVVSEDKLGDHDLEDVTVMDGLFCVAEKTVGPCADMFVIRDHLLGNHSERKVFFSEYAENSIDFSVERGSLLNPSLRPMLIKPRRWVLTTS